jgi:hypothetical protein
MEEVSVFACCRYGQYVLQWLYVLIARGQGFDLLPLELAHCTSSWTIPS